MSLPLISAINVLGTIIFEKKTRKISKPIQKFLQTRGFLKFLTPGRIVFQVF